MSVKTVYEARAEFKDKQDSHVGEAERLLEQSQPTATSIAAANAHALMATFYQREVANLTSVLGEM